MAGPEKEGYLLAFPHLKIGLHKQFLSLFYLCCLSVLSIHWQQSWERKSLFFTSSGVSGNTTLVTDPFLVWDLLSLILYLWHIPTVCHANSSTQECLEFRIRYLFFCVLTYFRKCRKICLVICMTLQPDLARMKSVQGWWALLTPNVTSGVVTALGTPRVFSAMDGDQALR